MDVCELLALNMAMMLLSMLRVSAATDLTECGRFPARIANTQGVHLVLSSKHKCSRLY